LLAKEFQITSPPAQEKSRLMEETDSSARLYPVNRETPLVEPTSPQALAAEDLVSLQRSAAGDSKAFGRLFERHGDHLFRIAASMLGNTADAEDVVQETFTGAFRGIKNFEGRSSVATWLARILVTQVSQFRRQKGRAVRKTEPIGEVATEGATAAAEKRIDLHAAMEQLSEEHREVLVLREFERMSYEEIAEVLGVPRGTVESRLHRARGELRERLKAYED
jgi:RNA polymerase sigma-70 factor (ECF subfamily)